MYKNFYVFNFLITTSAEEQKDKQIYISTWIYCNLLSSLFKKKLYLEISRTETKNRSELRRGMSKLSFSVDRFFGKPEMLDHLVKKSRKIWNVYGSLENSVRITKILAFLKISYARNDKKITLQNVASRTCLLYRLYVLCEGKKNHLIKPVGRVINFPPSGDALSRVRILVWTNKKYFFITL